MDTLSTGLSGQRPYFIRPDGNIVFLRVKGEIPYLVGGDEICNPTDPSETLCTPSYHFQPLASHSANPGVTADDLPGRAWCVIEQ